MHRIRIFLMLSSKSLSQMDRVRTPYSEVAEWQSRPLVNTTEGTAAVDTRRLLAECAFTSEWPVASLWRS